MQHIEFHLFRVKFIRPGQTSILHDSRTAAEVFKDSIAEKPSMIFKENHIWHIGNNETFDDNSGAFALGRTTKTTLPKYDKDSKNFTEELFEDSPYTFCVYDLSVGFVAVAKKHKLSPDVMGIARKLKVVLENSRPVQINEIRVVIDPISDPDGFILKLKSAYAIKKFTAHFTGPNPVDADALFQKPISVYCQATNGEKGKVEVEGQSLNDETLVAVTYSTAASGNEATAKIVESPGQAPKNIHLR